MSHLPASNSLRLRHLLAITGLLLTLFVTFCAAQTAVVISPWPQFVSYTQDGQPNAFGCVFTYQVNSTSPLGTYTDYTGTTLNQNPVILSAGGTANVWLAAGQAYTYKVMSQGGTNCSTGSTLYTVNGIGGGSTTLTTVVAYSATPVFTVSSQNQLFEMQLTGNASAQPLTAVGVTPPGYITFEIAQDASGGHTFSWPSNSMGGCTIGAVANQISTQMFVWNGTTALAIGPCVTSPGPEISVGNIVDHGLAVNSPVCTDSNSGLVSGSSCSSVLNITVNGQTIVPGGSGDANSGAATHSISLNEGNGSAITGLALGNNQIAVGQTSADPTASTIPTCAAGSHLFFSGTLPLTCTVDVAIQANSITTLANDASISAGSPTTVMTKSVTMPSAGCPCRAFVSYLVGATTSNAGGVEYWVSDGSNVYATGGTNTTGSVGPTTEFHATAASYSPVTYSNGGTATFSLVVESEQAITVKAASQFSSQNSWLNVAIFTSK